MKKTILLPLILFFGRGMTQPDESLIYLNESGKPVKAKKASILIQRLKFSDSLWQFNIYPINGPMFLSFQATDINGAVKNGRYVSYHSGLRDSAGYYTNNHREGLWTVYTLDQYSGLVFELKYENDQLISKKDSNDVEKERAARMDSLKLQRPPDTAEMESKFMGGGDGWARYLSQSLHYPDEAVNNSIQGTVIIYFVIDKEGKVTNASILKSVEYSLDKESLLIINQSSGRWLPAEHYGRKVKSYKKQPLEYRLQVQR